jgi:hypothetical protein
VLEGEEAFDVPLAEHGFAMLVTVTRAGRQHTSVAWWPGIVIVNAKDSTRDNEVYPLIDKWRDLLAEFGYEMHSEVEVGVPS